MKPPPSTFLSIGLRPSKDPHNPTYWSRKWKSSDGAIIILRAWEAMSRKNGIKTRFPAATIALECGNAHWSDTYAMEENHTDAHIVGANTAASQMAASLYTQLNRQPRPATSDLALIWASCQGAVKYVRPT